MNFSLINRVAASLLMARWKQTLVAAVGVTFSITMFITLLSFMSGLNDLLDGLIINRTPHVKLYNEIKASKNQPVQLSSEYKNHYNFIQSLKPKNQKNELYNATAIINEIKKDPQIEYDLLVAAEKYYPYIGTCIEMLKTRIKNELT